MNHDQYDNTYISGILHSVKTIAVCRSLCQ